MAHDLRYQLRTEKLVSEIANGRTMLGKVYRMIPAGLSVLDIGCHTGEFAAQLKQKGCRVTGLEINPQAAERASSVLDRAIAGNIESPEIMQRIEEKFDAVLFLDVLEHCQYPEEILARVRHLLQPDGFVLSSIPNIAYWKIRRDLLRGKFDYQPTGILDETHLRFFTIATVRELFAAADYKIEAMEFFLKPPKFLKQKIIPTLVARQFPGLFAFQMIVKARPVRIGS